MARVEDSEPAGRQEATDRRMWCIIPRLSPSDSSELHDFLAQRRPNPERRRVHQRRNRS